MNRPAWCFIVNLVVILAVAACDPNAKATATDRLVAPKERMSRAYESCATTADCADELRCLQNVCRKAQASVVGDYNAALGALALEAGDVSRAIDAYTAAVNRYESDKVEVPLEILCGKGHALVLAMDDRALAEQAARSLHECLRRAPVGSTLRAKALAGLAQLGRAGLDPELLARDETMSTYLTKQPVDSKPKDVKVKATGNAKTRSRTYTEFLELIQSQPVAAQLVACWEASYSATKQKTLSATFKFKYFFYEGYDESEDRDKLTITGPQPAAGTPERCLHDALVPVADEFSKGKQGGGRWDSDITVTIE